MTYLKRMDLDWIHIDQTMEYWLFCEHGNEDSGFVKHGALLDYLRKYQLPKMHSAPSLANLKQQRILSSRLAPKRTNELAMQ